MHNSVLQNFHDLSPFLFSQGPSCIFFSSLDILAGNQQLATELEFDIRKFEEMQAARAAEQRSMNHSVNHSTVIPSASQHGDMQQEDVKGR